LANVLGLLQTYEIADLPEKNKEGQRIFFDLRLEEEVIESTKISSVNMILLFFFSHLDSTFTSCSTKIYSRYSTS